MKEGFFLLKSNSIIIAVLRLKLWFSVYDTTIFHNFLKIFRYLPIFHVF